MTTSVTSSGTISSAGIGSGLDVNSIISKLMSVEQAPLTQLQSKATTIQTTISAFGAVQSALSTFRDAAQALTLPSTWQATTGTSSDPTAATVSTTSGAAAGNYAISVTNLASSQSTVSATYASGTALVGAGTLHINLGTWTGNAFATQTDPTTGAAKAGIDITATATDTLSTLADKINAANAGVSAAIVTDTTGSRLVLSSSTTGAANGFQVTNPDGALAGLAYDPSTGTTGTTLTQPGANANATINGLPVSSATNSLSNVLSGLTVNLLKTTTTPVQVSVAQDTASIKTAINTFVTAYNGLASLLATDTKYDATTSTAGPLQGDGTAVSLQRQLRNILGSSSTASTAFATLSQAGLQVQTDGTIKVNDATLTNALANPAQLKSLFAAPGASTTSTADEGFAQQFRAFGESALGTDGLLSSRLAGLNTSLTKNGTDQDALNDRLAATEARLKAQYTALDTKMATISTLSTYITQQIANWNKSNN
jgi:flagellar hook-associated protein 2